MMIEMQTLTKERTDLIFWLREKTLNRCVNKNIEALENQKKRKNEIKKRLEEKDRFLKNLLRQNIK